MAGEKQQFNFPEFEKKILQFWEKHHIFERTLAKTKHGKPFVFYEGPPTANGSPGIHHVEGRAFKDLILRYKTMRGFFVARRAGWDTHGLPVEIQVEKELGLKTKQDIERYGIAPFNAKAKESVWRYKEEWDQLTKRMGFWLDLKHPYSTYDPFYMETLWWIIKEFWKKKLLVEDFKILPWCTRCQTGLSTHELAQGYKLVKDKAVYVKFKLDAGQKIGNVVTDDKTYILAWTTTPWTLPGNVALAVHVDILYAIVAGIDGTFIAAKDKAPFLFEKFGSVIEKKIVFGKELTGLSYQPLFVVPELAKSEKAYKIYSADFVTAEDGTGVVHTAVMYGEDDYKLGKKIGLPTMHTVDETGRFISSLKDIGGLKAKNEETEKKIISLLEQHNNVFAVEDYEHDYPFCWRCATPLLYYARRGWWIKVSDYKKDLLANNKTINWIPEHFKSGRFGEFLKDVRDWAFSRERYWGTPLPVWKCASCQDIEVLGSIEELRQKSSPANNHYFFMRHGQALSNVRGITSSKGIGHILTPKGRKQIEVLAKKLLTKRGFLRGGKRYTIDMVVSSPIARAQQTAEIISSVLGIALHTDGRLAEINVGMLDGKKVNEYHAYFSSQEEKFIKRPVQGEHLGDVRRRVLNWMEEMERTYKGKYILVVSHEYPIWMAYAGARGLTNGETCALRNGKRANDFIRLAEMIEVPYVSLPRDETGEINLHRPFVDECVFFCGSCKKGMMKRISEVVDVWFDSGAMPFAQAHYPFDKKEKLPFPADYIAEAVDQTRGWFYTLLAVATLLGKKAPYKNVICYGHILDKNGQKMSKSKGNVVNPWDMIARYGIDTLRWYFYSINSPGDAKRFDEKDLLLKQRSFLGIWWNSFVLFDTYVKNIKKQKTKNKKINHILLDRWIIGKTNKLIYDVTVKLDTYDITGASRAIEQFTVFDFSQWYLRRSRERFQRPRSQQEKDQAAQTTACVLDVLCRITAPFTPFLSEYMYQELCKNTGEKTASVHLLDWPNVSKLKEDAFILNKSISFVRDICSQALKRRAELGIKVRQPLAKLEIAAESPFRKRDEQECINMIKDEVNVKEVLFGRKIGMPITLDERITLELREEGIVREFTRNIQEMRRDLGLKPGKKAHVMISGVHACQELIMRWQRKIQEDTNLHSLHVAGKRQFRIEREMEIDDMSLWVGMR